MARETISDAGVPQFEGEGKSLWQGYLDAPLGFRNHWYPALFSGELAEGELKGEVVLGERIALKRVDGAVYAFEDRCVHRGVRFSARPECYTKNTITCWYHGFTYNVKSGALVRILTAPYSQMEAALRTYRTCERSGLVFVFVGDLQNPPALETDLPPGFLQPSLVARGIRRTVHANWRLAAENGFDPTHIYIHRNDPLVRSRGRPQPFATRSPAPKGPVESESGARGMYVHTKGGEAPIFEVDIEGEIVRSPRAPRGGEQPPAREVVTSIWLPGVLEVENFPTTGMTQFEWYVALDERRHTYWQVVGRQAEDAEMAQRFYEEVDSVWRTMALTTGFNDSDVFAREQLDVPYGEEDHWHRERLFEPDAYITQWRMLASRYNRGIQTPWFRAPG